MSRKYLERYNSFSREILLEVLSEDECRVLDDKYTKAKTIRGIKRALTLNPELQKKLEVTIKELQ